MSTETAKMRARYTGNKTIAYRWVGEIGSGKLVHAQTHPAAVVLEDTWSSSPDARVPTKTMVELPMGLLVLDSTAKGSEHTYTAGVLDNVDPKNTINWDRARYISTKRVDRVAGNPRAGKLTVHTIEVDGKRSEYTEQ